MERRVSHLSLNRLEKGGAAIFPPFLLANFKLFDQDLIVEHGKQYAIICIYCVARDFEASIAGHS